jgi:hypothetical protein
MSPSKLSLGTLVASAAAMGVAFGFQAPSVASRSSAGRTALSVAVDPTTVTKKDYQDICGVSFDEGDLASRLVATNYLYPKHVEVIEDIAPIAGEMVDEIVRCPN